MKENSREHYDLAYKYLKEERGLEEYDNEDLEAAMIRVWIRYKKENPMAGYEDWDLSDPVQKKLYDIVKAVDDDELDEGVADNIEAFSDLIRNVKKRREREDAERKIKNKR